MLHLILKVSLHMSCSTETSVHICILPHSCAAKFAGMLTSPLWRAVQQGCCYAKRKYSAVHNTTVVSLVLS